MKIQLIFPKPCGISLVLGLVAVLALLSQTASGQQIDYNRQLKNKPAINTVAPLSGGATLNPSATLQLTPCAAFQFYRTNAGASGWQCIGVTPLASDNIQYVSASGNDSNDGLSWGSAKLTAAAALAAIGASPGVIYESPAIVSDGIAGTGSATGLNGWIWAPQRFYAGPLNQATSANTGVDSRRIRLSGSVWNGSKAVDDFWEFYVNSFPGSFTNGSNLILQHSSVENGAGRVLHLSDVVIGPPGTATSTQNFNSFAFDNQGAYWDGSAQNMLWEMANTVTPTSGFPVTFRQNFVPIFSDSCAGCSAEVAFGGSGSLSAAGNYSGTPKWLWPNLNGSFFTASFNHSLTANRSYTYPDASGILPTLAGSTGQLQFNGAANLAADSNLFWDNSNKFLGIGTSSPSVPFHLRTTGSGGAMQMLLDNGAAGGTTWYIGSTDNGNGVGGGFFVINPGTSTSTAAFRIDSSKNIYLQSQIKTYNAISTVSNGVPAEYGTVDLAAQGANIAATTIYAVPATGAGMYRACFYSVVTRVATTSSTLPSTSITWTDNDNGTAQSFTLTPTNSGNALITLQQACMVLNAKASANIQYSTTGFASSGTTSMQYALHGKIEAL